MLLELRLSAFKCFSELKLRLRPLTLLAGVNGGGKSTVLQALVLLHQALTDGVKSGVALEEHLPLNGSLVALGSLRDVVDKATGGKTFRIGLSTAEADIRWEFTSERREALAASVLGTSWQGGPLEDRPGGLFPASMPENHAGREIRRILTEARYVPADRFGPSEVYPLLEPGRHSTLGPRAERAVGALYWRREDAVEELLRHPSRRDSNRVDRQVEAWLNDLFPGAALQVQPVTDVQGVPTANLITLGIRTSDATDYHRPQHVGFGMTYVLPILIALVSAKPGDLVLLENPEAHLHPRAQVRVAELCVRAAQAGIQVLLETHSDHVLNGVRVAVHRKKLSPQDVGINFFSRPNRNGPPIRREIALGAGGGLMDRPDGFFDEIERQLTELLEPPNDTGESSDEQVRSSNDDE